MSHDRDDREDSECGTAVAEAVQSKAFGQCDAEREGGKGWGVHVLTEW